MKLETRLHDSMSAPSVHIGLYALFLKKGKVKGKVCSRNMVFKGKNGSKTEFHRNGLLATLGSNFQEGQN